MHLKPKTDQSPQVPIQFYTHQRLAIGSLPCALDTNHFIRIVAAHIPLFSRPIGPDESNDGHLPIASNRDYYPRIMTRLKATTRGHMEQAHLITHSCFNSATQRVSRG